MHISLCVSFVFTITIVDLIIYLFVFAKIKYYNRYNADVSINWRSLLSCGWSSIVVVLVELNMKWLTWSSSIFLHSVFSLLGIEFVFYSPGVGKKYTSYVSCPLYEIIAKGTVFTCIHNILLNFLSVLCVL